MGKLYVTQVSRYQEGKTNLDFTEARDSEWHWHQLGHMQVCTSLHTDNNASTPPLMFLQAGCPSCRQTNNIKALKANSALLTYGIICHQRLLILDHSVIIITLPIITIIIIIINTFV